MAVLQTVSVTGLFRFVTCHRLNCIKNVRETRINRSSVESVDNLEFAYGFKKITIATNGDNSLLTPELCCASW